MIRVTVPREVADALMDGSLRLLVVEGYWPPGFVTDDDHPPTPNLDIAKVIEAGERIGIDVERETSVHLRPGRECIDNPACTDGLVRVGSVRPVRVLPVVRNSNDWEYGHIDHIDVMGSSAYRRTPTEGFAEDVTDLTDALAVYGPAESLVGKFAVEVEDARREP